MLLNFRMENGIPSRPILFCRKKTGPAEVIRITKAMIRHTGTIMGSAASTSATSKQRLAGERVHGLSSFALPDPHLGRTLHTDELVEFILRLYVNSRAPPGTCLYQVRA